MVRAFVLAVLAGGVMAVPCRPAAADNKKDAGTFPEAASIVRKLHGQRVNYDKDLQATTLRDVLADLGKAHGVTFVIDNASLEEIGFTNDSKAEKLSTTGLNGLALGKFLDVYLRGLGAPSTVTYLVREDYIEITTREMAQREAGLAEAIEKAETSDDPEATVRARARLNLPLVCVAVEKQPLSAVLNELTRVYGLNVIVEPGAKEPLKTVLTERLLNVPADTALELLAGQAGLSVVRKGNTFRVGGGFVP